jgi:hypothetical protein
MHDAEIQREVRLAIERTDELSRGEHARHHELIAQLLDAVRSSLIAIDEALGGGRSPAPHLGDLSRLDARLRDAFDRLGPSAREEGELLVRRLRALDRALTASARRSAGATPPFERWAPELARGLCWTAASLGRAPITRGLGVGLGLAVERAVRGDATSAWPAAAVGIAAIALPWTLRAGRRERFPAALMAIAGAVALGVASRSARRRAAFTGARAPFSGEPIALVDTYDEHDEDLPNRPTHPGFAGTH